ncbi:MAG: AzlC family ABC transporter permease [Lachnospiraceae bacterium]|nr:AzlC family ABC transporter permease [Lachnospiraceae bacterium]
MDKKQAYLNGLRDGIPIGLGYFAVAFSLGIIAKKAGLNAVEGFFASALSAASAGEYALLSSMIAHATFLETALISVIANIRYLLMTTALSQRFSEKTPLYHRIFIAFYTTDEIFGAMIARPGAVIPQYAYGLVTIAVPLWGFGCSAGIIAGNVLPVRAVSALSVALYGMFLAIIVPPAKRERPVLVGVCAGFLLSFLLSRLPAVKELSSGTRTIILTILISAALAVFAPVPKEDPGPSESGSDRKSRP